MDYKERSEMHNGRAIRRSYQRMIDNLNITRADMDPFIRMGMTNAEAKKAVIKQKMRELKKNAK